MKRSPLDKPLWRWALPIVAVALLIAGLAGPASRAWQEQQVRREAAANAARVAQEREALSLEFNANRERILADVRAQLDAGHYSEAMKSAGRFVPAGDPELLGLYRKAAGSESSRQRAAYFSDLIARDCNEGQARAQLLHLQAHERRVPTDPLPPVSIASVKRVPSAPARAAVFARLQEPPPPELSTVQDADWLTRIRTEHRARLLPDYQAGLAGTEGDALICVWRLEGTRRTGARDVRFSIDLWLAPSPDGRSLQADPVGYTESPA